MPAYIYVSIAITVLLIVSYFIIRDEPSSHTDIKEDPTEDYWDNDEPHTENDFH